MSFETAYGTVLVVDDEPKVLFFLNQLFTPRGYQVITASSGEAALSMIEEFPDDIHFMFLDLRMPGMDGAEVLKTVKQKFPQIPVGVLTAYEDRREECVKLGADFFITKPYSISSLYDCLEQMVKKHQRPKPVPVEIKPGYIASAKILIVDDEEDLCDFLKEQLEKAVESALGEYQLEFANDGKAGLEKNREFEPDIILVDIKMPRLRGDEMIAIIEKEGPRPKDYVILTAMDNEEDKRKIRKSRYPFLSKPFNIDKFCEDLRALCFKHGLIRKI